MKLNKRLIAAAITGAALSPLAALAQTSTGSSTATGTRGLGSTEAASYSFIPSTSRGYVGLNLGKPRLAGNCAAGFVCDDPNVGGKIHTGGSWNDVLGAEIGYINLARPIGPAERRRREASTSAWLGTSPSPRCSTCSGRWARPTAGRIPRRPLAPGSRPAMKRASH